jgi:hypothetical protein
MSSVVHDIGLGMYKDVLMCVGFKAFEQWARQ